MSGTRASSGIRPRRATSRPVTANTASAISATSSGVGRSLLALARSNSPLSPGSTVSPPTSTLGVRGLPLSPAMSARASLSFWRSDCSFPDSGWPSGPVAPGRLPPLSDPLVIAPARTSRQLPYSSLSVGRLSSAFWSSEFE